MILRGVNSSSVCGKDKIQEVCDIHILISCPESLSFVAFLVLSKFNDSPSCHKLWQYYWIIGHWEDFLIQSGKHCSTLVVFKVTNHQYVSDTDRVFTAIS